MMITIVLRSHVQGTVRNTIKYPKSRHLLEQVSSLRKTFRVKGAVWTGEVSTIAIVFVVLSGIVFAVHRSSESVWASHALKRDFEGCIASVSVPTCFYSKA